MTYTLGTVCARGGSQGIPGKNLRALAGHPLIAYAVAQAKRCAFIDRVIVSTDSEEIASVAKRYGADVPFLRPAELARDVSPKIPVLQHAVREIERQLGHPIDFVVDLDPTAPLRADADVAACWAAMSKPETDVVFTVTAADRNPYFNMVELDPNGYARLSKEPATPVARRQDAPPVYGMNAAVYVYRRAHLMNDGRVVGGRARIVEMPAERSRDVDREIDLAFIEFLVREGRVALPPVAS